MQYATPREDCPICLDERQYVGWGGQQWTTMAGAGEFGQARPLLPVPPHVLALVQADRAVLTLR